MNILEKTFNYYQNFKGEKGIIGYSAKEKPLYYFCVEKTKSPVIICQYAMHAREYVTTYLALKQIEDFIERGKRGKVYFVPMVNPDGVEIALKHNPLYKSNANGVDLNVNFDARWGEGKHNVLIKGDQNFIGEKPFSESETRALRDFTYKVNPSLTLSYHSKGEEIYWEFGQEDKARDLSLAKALKIITGYAVKRTPFSCGGYKDWCIESLKIPSFTIEVGNDSLPHPLGEENVEAIFEQNKEVILYLTEKLSEKRWKLNL